ncbi:LON peptidase substrate-binding domain-containing protein [Aquimixticola soesokkakensis]|nr:LON peptidase substrate-binding domain-containing protein [Aquimixticola soesokkakensis]
MIHAADLPSTIPIFPLPGALLLPRARLPLHLFEPRYLQMLEDVLKTGTRLIGMVQPMEHANDGARLHSIGCAGRVTGFSETEDGRYMITLAGMSRFRLGQEVDGFAAYRRFAVSWAGFDKDLVSQPESDNFDRKPLFSLLERYLDAEGLRTDWDGLEDAEDELLINSLAMLCPFETEDKQALLEAPSLSTRRETLVTLMEFALRGGSSDEMM